MQRLQGGLLLVVEEAGGLLEYGEFVIVFTLNSLEVLQNCGGSVILYTEPTAPF